MWRLPDCHLERSGKEADGKSQRIGELRNGKRTIQPGINQLVDLLQPLGGDPGGRWRLRNNTARVALRALLEHIDMLFCVERVDRLAAQQYPAKRLGRRDRFGVDHVAKTPSCGPSIASPICNDDSQVLTAAFGFGIDITTRWHVCQPVGLGTKSSTAVSAKGMHSRLSVEGESNDRLGRTVAHAICLR